MILAPVFFETPCSSPLSQVLHSIFALPRRKMASTKFKVTLNAPTQAFVNNLLLTFVIPRLTRNPCV